MNYNDKPEVYAVYGTLRKGQGNYSRILKNNSKHIGTKKISGYSMFSLGGFPGISKTKSKNKNIVVDLFEVSCPETKRRLDILEGYNPSTNSGMYLKENINIDNKKANIYIWNYKDSGSQIKNGDWVEYINEQRKKYE